MSSRYRYSLNSQAVTKPGALLHKFKGRYLHPMIQDSQNYLLLRGRIPAMTALREIGPSGPELTSTRSGNQSIAPKKWHYQPLQLPGCTSLLVFVPH